MSTSGDVQITITDGAAGAVVVPGSSVQLVIGCCSGGTAAQIVATRSPQTLQSTSGYGLGVEAAALACNAGGTVLFMKAATNAIGTATAVTLVGTGTSTVTTTLDGTTGAFDDYLVKLTVVKGGTIATTGILFTVSLDAGRATGPTIALGTANTYVIPNTGITVNFGAGTLVAADKITFSTKGPAWATSGVQACVTAFQASQYATIGIGSAHVVGPMSGANAATIAGYFDTLASGFVFSRCMMDVRDAFIPIAWGGAGETEAAWTTSVLADFAAASAKRALAGVGFYNMPSPFPNAAAGAPRYRRCLTWAQAARQVAIPPQRHSGRVRDGALSQIVVDPTSDPSDGFVYHDERINPSFDILTGGAGRFTSARTRVGLPGVYIVNPLLLSPIGSDFTILPLGNVMDLACSITHQVGQQVINADVRLNPNGTIYENEARAIEQTLLNALNDHMTSVAMISSAKVSVDRSTNVQSTSKVVVTVTIYARGYVLEEDVNIGFGSSAAAA